MRAGSNSSTTEQRVRVVGSTPIECITYQLKEEKKSKSCLYSFIVIVFNVLTVKNIIYIFGISGHGWQSELWVYLLFCSDPWALPWVLGLLQVLFYSYLDFIQQGMNFLLENREVEK